MVLPAAAAMLVPAGWTDQQALGLAVNWPTALAALKPLGQIATGETVLIHAAAGATGQAAVKMAKHYGATVMAAAAPGKHDTVLAVGADRGRRGRPQPAHRVRTGRRRQSANGTGSEGHRRQTGGAALRKPLVPS